MTPRSIREYCWRNGTWSMPTLMVLLGCVDRIRDRQSYQALSGSSHEIWVRLNKLARSQEFLVLHLAPEKVAKLLKLMLSIPLR